MSELSIIPIAKFALYGKRADDERCNERRIRNSGGGGVSEWLNWLYWLLARAIAVPSGKITAQLANRRKSSYL